MFKSRDFSGGNASEQKIKNQIAKKPYFRAFITASKKNCALSN